MPDEAKAQEALPGLLKDFLAFTERELRCPGGAAREWRGGGGRLFA
ncbi:hypothetical protein [Streptomyces sp. cmx-4-7]